MIAYRILLDADVFMSYLTATTYTGTPEIIDAILKDAYSIHVL